MALVFGSWTYDLLALAATLILLAYVKIKSKFRYFSDRNIPHLKVTFSNIVMSFLRRATETMQIMYDEAKDDPYSGVYQFLSPGFFIRDPQLVQKIMIKDFSHFQNHGLPSDEERDPLEGHLFNLNGDKWRLLRYKLAPTFTSGKLKRMLPLMEESADRVVNNLKKKTNLDDQSVRDVFLEFSIAVIATCAFGIDGESVSDPNCKLRKVLDQVFKPSVPAIMKLFFRILLPRVAKAVKLKVTAQEIEDFFINLTKESFELRKKTGVKRDDFIQLLLELKEKGTIEIDTKDLEEDEKYILNEPLNHSDQPSAKLEFTDELLSAQIFVFWLAGYENATQVLSMTTYLLSKNKDMQDSLRKEVKEIKERHGGINYTALRDMKLLDACVSESLRIYPPGVILLRKCTKTYTLDDGNQIEKDQSLIIPVTAIHNDAKYWKNPSEFNPYRFIEEEVVPGSYLPFGSGPRICIAQRFALLETKMMLAKLIESFELSPSEKTKEPIQFEKLNQNMVKGGLWVNLKPVDKS